ncbi:Hypothetical_protein [Hexamita inflata]|uniref:Hypothetical_protein n=1 Tax=Hexamita inflata TaxID=28002 RepID=A0AA86TK90_9EUKA|nr:Hypothetical protein HINF_LOCUS7545 [Hexamita inflata]
MTDCGYFSSDYCNDECQKQFQFYVCTRISPSDYCCGEVSKAEATKIFIIVGVVLGVLAILGIVGGVLGCYFCRKFAKRNQNQTTYVIGGQIQQSYQQPIQYANNIQSYQQQMLQPATM